MHDSPTYVIDMSSSSVPPASDIAVGGLQPDIDHPSVRATHKKS
jgi:hypothetical protein